METNNLLYSLAIDLQSRLSDVKQVTVEIFPRATRLFIRIADTYTGETMERFSYSYVEDSIPALEIINKGPIDNLASMNIRALEISLMRA